MYYKLRAYNPLGSHFGLALVAPHDLMDFIEVLTFNRAIYDARYEMLNLGFRVTPTAGTDYPCGPSLPGRERFYTHTGATLDFDSWLRSVNQGHVFVTNGPMIEFDVNGQLMGGEISLDGPDSVFVEARL